MTHHHPEEVIKKVCEQMGEDLEAPFCKEVTDHLKECPNCKIYFDTVKKTVVLCRELEEQQNMPADVRQRLLKILRLDKTA
jgi:predicted anti-sigma-YlaC factor YlaD